jgi:hypothetical protein
LLGFVLGGGVPPRVLTTTGAVLTNLLGRLARGRGLVGATGAGAGAVSSDGALTDVTVVRPVDDDGVSSTLAVFEDTDGKSGGSAQRCAVVTTLHGDLRRQSPPMALSACVSVSCSEKSADSA